METIFSIPNYKLNPIPTKKIKQNIGLACCDSTSPPDVPQSYANLSFTLLLGFKGALLILVTMLPSAVQDGH